MVLLALASLPKTLTVRGEMLLAWLVLVLWTATHVVFFGEPRYRLPILPILLTFAAVALIEIAQLVAFGVRARNGGKHRASGRHRNGRNVSDSDTGSRCRTSGRMGTYAPSRSWRTRPRPQGGYGFFMWDHISDAASARAGCVLRPVGGTNRDRAADGAHPSSATMIAPVARRRAVGLARQTATLDVLSGGRLTLGVGLGYPPEEFSTFGDDADERVRAQKLDEGLDVLTGLWSGRPFSYQGEHYRIAETTFAPAPVQSPRIPIWVGGMWPNKPPFRRAARWDGAFPIHANISPMTPQDVRDVVAYVEVYREGGAFDVVLSGEHGGGGPYAWKEPLSSYAEAGATWWLETLTDWRGSVAEMRPFVAAGPSTSDDGRSPWGGRDHRDRVWMKPHALTRSQPSCSFVDQCKDCRYTRTTDSVTAWPSMSAVSLWTACGGASTESATDSVSCLM